MKKIFIVLLAVTFFCVSEVSYAALLKSNAAKGAITAINLATNEITVDNYRSGRMETYVVPPGVINTLQRGMTVIVISKPGSKIATSVRVVVPRTPRVAATPTAAPTTTVAPTRR